MTLSPDGKRIAFIGAVQEPVRSYSEPDLWVLDLQPGAAPKNLTADYDYDVNSGVGGDNRAPRAPGHLSPVWSKDGSHLLDVVAKQGRAILVSVDATSGKVQELSRGDQAVEQFDTSDDGKVVVMNVSTPTMIDELFVLNPGRLAAADHESQRSFVFRAESDRARRRSGTPASMARRSRPGYRSRPTSTRRRSIR